MTKDLTDAGDPRRSIALLWGRHEPGRRGPKARLSPEKVIQAAIALADAEGLSALSMRRVAEAVGVSPMSLYTYVPSKAELVDMMFDRVLGDTADPGTEVVTWREKMAFMARERWALSERHPWLLDLAVNRPPLGPNFMRKAQVMVRALDGMNLEPLEVALAADALQDYITGALRTAREAREAVAHGGLTDEEWFARVGLVLEQHMAPEDFEAVNRLTEARRRRAHLPTLRSARFEFGLQRMLDGLEAFIQARGKAAG